MSVKLGRKSNDLFELWVRHAALDLDHDGLVHFVGHHDSDALLASGRLGWCFLWGSFAHDLLKVRWIGLNSDCLLFALRLDGADHGDLTPNQTQAAGVFELSALLLHPQMQAFLGKFTPAGAKLLNGHFTQFLDLHLSSRVLKGLVRSLANHESGAQAKLGSSKAAGVTCRGLVHAGDLKQHRAWINHSHPELWAAFAFTHPGFRWPCGYWLVGEDPNEDLALTLEVTGDRDTAGFDLVILDPAAVHGLKAELTVIELIADGGIACSATTLRFPVFYSAGQKCHNVSSPIVLSRLIGCLDLYYSAAATGAGAGAGVPPTAGRVY